jgi:hypothetical protein
MNIRPQNSKFKIQNSDNVHVSNIKQHDLIFGFWALKFASEGGAL